MKTLEYPNTFSYSAPFLNTVGVIPKLHTFEQALKALKEGKTIKRQSSDVEFYHDSTLDKIDSALPYVNEKYNGKKYVTISFSDDDILAKDWIIIDKDWIIIDKEDVK